MDGTLNSSGVYMRAGPGQSYSRVGTYSSGTQLKIYEVVYGTGGELDYYFVKVVKENLYGYIAAKFVDKAGLLPGESATPTPKAIAGTIPGTVSASVVALRTMPTTEGNTPIGEAKKGDSVLIYFKTGTSTTFRWWNGRAVLRGGKVHHPQHHGSDRYAGSVSSKHKRFDTTARGRQCRGLFFYPLNTG